MNRRSCQGGETGHSVGSFRRFIRTKHFTRNIFTHTIPEMMIRLFSKCLIMIGLLSGSVAVAQNTEESGVSIVASSDGAAVPRKMIENGNRSAEAWEILPGKQQLFKAEKELKIPPSGELFVELTYLDQGYGRLTVLGSGANGKELLPDKYTRAVLTDSKLWVTSMQRLTGLKPGEPVEFRVRMDKNPTGLLAIAKGKVQTTAFKDPVFNYLISEPWRRPYAGPTMDGIDNKTLKGKVMVGYQGWYRTPNDPYDRGWVHWGDIPNGRFSVDQWPDTSAYPIEMLDKAGDIKTQSGKTAYLFSSAWPHSTRLHFSWMRKHNIDGAFLQRFLTDGTFATTGRAEWVMGNVRDAANREGRIWAVEYDVSGCPDDKLLESIQKDWKWLIDEFGLKDDKAYARENGKPVVFVWGMAVGGRNIRPETAEAVFDFLQNDPKYGGNYVIGGLPGNWRKLGPEWQNHIRQQDGALAWMSQSFAEDIKDFKELGVDYFPHVKPGFSWSNLKHIPTGANDAFTPREGGEFYERQLVKAAEAGADRLFVGMFDEYDESTAIMPMSDDPPPTPRRPGVNVKIYDKDRWEGRAVHKTIPQLDLELAPGSPGRDLPETGYSAILDGTIQAPADGSYTFTIEAPEGGKVSFDILDQKIRNVMFPAEKPASVTVDLKAGELTAYKIEYVHGSTPGKIQMFWEHTGSARELVPASSLVDAWGRFITNEGKPSDHWLSLTGKFKEKIKAPAKAK